MSAPDYSEGLRKAGFWPRQIGYGLIIAGAITVLWLKFGGHPENPQLWTAAFVVLGIGWVLVILAMLLRTRYHRRLLGG